MKSFEQIAEAMFRAFMKERKRQGSKGVDHTDWSDLSESQRASWIAAAKQAAAELAVVH